MSTLEKTIDLLQNMPEQSIQNVYDFVQTLLMRQSKREMLQEESVFKRSYSQSNIIPVEQESKALQGLRILQSFAGRLPEDFDYKHELEEMRQEKYDSFN